MYIYSIYTLSLTLYYSMHYTAYKVRKDECSSKGTSVYIYDTIRTYLKIYIYYIYYIYLYILYILYIFIHIFIYIYDTISTYLNIYIYGSKDTIISLDTGTSGHQACEYTRYDLYCSPLYWRREG